MTYLKGGVVDFKMNLKIQSTIPFWYKQSAKKIRPRSRVVQKTPQTTRLFKIPLTIFWEIFQKVSRLWGFPKVGYLWGFFPLGITGFSGLPVTVAGFFWWIFYGYLVVLNFPFKYLIWFRSHIFSYWKTKADIKKCLIHLSNELKKAICDPLPYS